MQLIFLFPFLFIVSEHLLAQYNAIKMLHSRVKMILEYAKAVKNGKNSFLFWHNLLKVKSPLLEQVASKLLKLTLFFPLSQTFPKF